MVNSRDRSLGSEVWDLINGLSAYCKCLVCNRRPNLFVINKDSLCLDRTIGFSNCLNKSHWKHSFSPVLCAPFFLGTFSKLKKAISSELRLLDIKDRARTLHCELNQGRVAAYSLDNHILTPLISIV